MSHTCTNNTQSISPLLHTHRRECTRTHRLTTQHASHCEVSVPHPLTILLLFSKCKYSNRCVKAGDGVHLLCLEGQRSKVKGVGGEVQKCLYYFITHQKQNNRTGSVSKINTLKSCIRTNFQTLHSLGLARH